MAKGHPAKHNLWAFIDKPSADACWEWQGYRIKQGYGIVVIDGAKWLTHRLMWSVVEGEIPDGLHVCHRCDNPPCCNPRHLFLGTRSDNMRDKVAKGRANYPRGRHPSAKLTPAQVLGIRRDYVRGVTSLAEVGRKYGVSLHNVSLIVNGKAWAWLTAGAA